MNSDAYWTLDININLKWIKDHHLIPSGWLLLKKKKKGPTNQPKTENISAGEDVEKLKPLCITSREGEQGLNVKQ